MNTDELKKELRRQRRANYIQSWIIFVAIVLAIFYCSSQIKNLKQQVHVLSTSQVRPLDGKDGNNGVDGIDGYGVDGRDGKSVTSEQIAMAVSEYLTLNPPAPGAPGQGIPGKDGEDAPVLDIQIDPVTCTLQKKLSVDTIWLDVAQLPLGSCGLSGTL